MNIVGDDIVAWLGDAEFPADRDDLLRLAQQSAAPLLVIEELRRLPAKGFNGRYEVRHALRGDAAGSQTISLGA